MYNTPEGLNGGAVTLYKSVHLSVLGVCTSRDIFRICDKESNYIVDCFIQHINPLSVACHTSLLDNKVYNNNDDLRSLLNSWWNNLPDFDIRNASIDIEKRTINILKEKKSQYIVLDFACLKYGMVFFDKEFKKGLTKLHYDYFSHELTQYFGRLVQEFNIDEVDELDEKVLYNLLDGFMQSILEIYNQNEIVFVELYAVDKYIKSGKIDEEEIVNSSYWIMNKKDVGKLNSLYKKAFTYLHTNYPACHVIPFLYDMLGDVGHTWGKGDLHYINEYYEYAYEAMNIIIANHSELEERRKIEFLQDKYNNCIKNLLDSFHREKCECELE